VAPATNGVVNDNVCPTQSGDELDAVGVEGVLLMTTIVVEGELAQPLLAVTV
jgi:hypothetical protein